MKEENFTSDVEAEMSEAMHKLLPEKSKSTYEKEYKLFKKWQNSKNIHDATEGTVLAYFLQKSKTVKPSTLWSYYSMLKSTLMVNENCDISKYSKVISFLKKVTKGFKSKKSKTFERSDIIRFLKDATDDEYLLIKVVAIMGIYGACRSDELHKLKFSNVDDQKSVMIISLFDTKTKMDRSFCITDRECEVNVLSFVRKYISLRPKNMPHQKFFINYRQNKCTVQPVGINTFYKIPKTIAEFLKFENPALYTGHCFRRSAATMVANSGGDIVHVKRVGGWKSSSTAESYIENSLTNKIAVSEKILAPAANNQSKENKNLEILPGQAINISDDELPPIINVIYTVNCGGTAYVDTNGIYYDKDPQTGSSDTLHANLAIRRITADDYYIYKTVRYSTNVITYELPVQEDDKYHLILKFLESYTAPNNRIFDIILNKLHTVASNFDIYERATDKVAYDEHVSFSIKNSILHYKGAQSNVIDKKISIQFVGKKNAAVISAILLVKGELDDRLRVKLPPVYRAKIRASWDTKI